MLYRDLALVRRFDTEATALQRQGELGIWASLLGQEAAQIGSGRALLPGDMAFPTYREHGVAWCRGVGPESLLELFRGVNFGGWDPKEHNFALYTIVIGAQTLHATGYAMGMQRDGTENAVIAYFGDGASSEGDVNEAFIFAASYNAPVVFFLQNNQWAISVPEERQSRIPLFRRAHGFGFPGVRVDGNDVLACLAVTRKALQHAREGQGPFSRRGVHLPHGCAHDVGRPDPLSARERARELEVARPHRAREGLLSRNGLAERRFTSRSKRGDELAARVRDRMPVDARAEPARHLQAGICRRFAACRRRAR